MLTASDSLDRPGSPHHGVLPLQQPGPPQQPGYVDSLLLWGLEASPATNAGPAAPEAAAAAAVVAAAAAAVAAAVLPAVSPVGSATALLAMLPAPDAFPLDGTFLRLLSLLSGGDGDVTVAFSHGLGGGGDQPPATAAATSLVGYMPSVDAWRSLAAAAEDMRAGGCRLARVHSRLPHEDLQKLWAPRAAGSGGSAPDSLPRQSFLGPQELERYHFMEQSGGYTKAAFLQISQPQPEAGPLAGHEARHAAAAASAPVWPAAGGAPSATMASASSASSASSSAVALEVGRGRPFAAGCWYLVDSEVSTHCLQHHGLSNKKNKCRTQHPQDTHSVHKVFPMFCVAAAPPRPPGPKKDAKGKGTRKRETVGMHEGCGALYHICIDHDASGQTVEMLFGTTWPAWYTAHPPGGQADAPHSKRRGGQGAASVADAAAAAAGGSGAQAIAIAAGDKRGLAARDSRPPADAADASASAASASADGNESMGSGAAAAAGDSGASAGGSAGSRAASGGGARRRLADGPEVEGPDGRMGAVQEEAGPDRERARSDARLAIDYVSVCLRSGSGSRAWSMFLQHDMCGADGQLDLARLRRLRDGNDAGLGVLNIILNAAAELLGLTSTAAASGGGVGAAAAPAPPQGPGSPAWEEKKADVEARVVEVFQSLFEACQRRDPVAVHDLLLQQDVQWLDTALHTCCRYNLLRVLRWLLPKCRLEALVAATKSGWPPSTSGCRAGNEDAVVAIFEELRDRRAMGSPRCQQVLLADLSPFNEYYERHRGRQVLERALARVWPDPSTRPRVREDVRSKQELRDAANSLRLQLQELQM
ncbi:hypothetical protein GPECTOR_14g210 [Gonium pectorale]|uniref:Uncharacterized protein n=1 Tax=Gonium pectorale TaxID=33097 RepID=A0A150GME0_GONPE|nr:hypothetical protein GPECTOR_14g210 [Gonium pectorale]|eukprot:KXZ50967.1 hypothetical protein GPECTOR_14g210 [Gonium pectorale]